MAGLLSKIAGGVNRFSDELLAPTTGLGKLGMYLGAASGGVLGQASLANQKDQRADEMAGLKQQLLLAKLAGQGNDLTGLQKDLRSAGIMPGTDEYKSAILNATSRGLPTGFQFNAQGEAAPIGGVVTPEQMEANRDRRFEETQAAAERRQQAMIAAMADRQNAGFAHQDSNQNNDIIKQARDAIARGADPAKVRARLASMGVRM